MNSNNTGVEMGLIEKKKGISGIGRGTSRVSVIKNTLHIHKVTMKSIYV